MFPQPRAVGTVTSGPGPGPWGGGRQGWIRTTCLSVSPPNPAGLPRAGVGRGWEREKDCGTGDGEQAERPANTGQGGSLLWAPSVLVKFQNRNLRGGVPGGKSTFLWG